MNDLASKSARRSVPPLLVILVLLTGCNMSITFGEGIEASGELVSTTFEVEDFDSLAVQDTFNVFVTVGDTQAVQTLSNENLVEHLEIRVRNGELQVGLKNGVSISNGTLEATITVPDVSSIDASGASSTHVVGLDRNDIAVEVSGASDLVIEGRATSVTVDASGASNIDLQLVDVNDTHIDLSGSTSLELLSTQRASGEMSGASDLTLPAEADLDIKTSGASDITGR